MADFFDRLLARSLPGHAVSPGEAVVHPRLPQRFERAPVEVEEREFTLGAAPAGPPPASTLVVREREVGITRVEPAASSVVTRVVESAEPAPAEERRIPVTPPVPVPVRVDQPVAGATAPAVVNEQTTTINVTVAGRQQAGTLVPSAAGVVADPLRPTPPLPARSAGRRDEVAAPQRVVQVSIGRVEVTAAGSERPAAKRPTRPEPVVSLDRYLAREDGRR